MIFMIMSASSFLNVREIRSEKEMSPADQNMKTGAIGRSETQPTDKTLLANYKKVCQNPANAN